ncbi:hypothetical protein FIBSPDRAFT_895483 [Athelia psychrophila]|uniref:Uncharacterized protein n=1 Tax=Athelia psychrophila TaxID=1759441 RepID=A0A166EJ20_9AGAM|nr:hypothetical protein FIBSPDRAFT_895483 [Fibularhizoctonia sp. CBS 109695]
MPDNDPVVGVGDQGTAAIAVGVGDQGTAAIVVPATDAGDNAPQPATQSETGTAAFQKNTEGTQNPLDNLRGDAGTGSMAVSGDHGSGPTVRGRTRRQIPTTTTCTMKVAGGVCGARLPPEEIEREVAPAKGCPSTTSHVVAVSESTGGKRETKMTMKDRARGPARYDTPTDSNEDGSDDGISANGEYSRTVEITVVRGLDATAVVIHNGRADGCVVGNNIQFEGMVTARI